MKTIAITNQKGGSAKTTTAVNLGAALGASGKKVLIIDMDPQASATSWFGVETPSPSSLDALLRKAKPEEAIQGTSTKGVSIIPATPKLSILQEAVLENDALSMHRNELLRKALAKFKGEAFDYALIDCPPNLGIASKNALIAADSILIPVEAHYMALEGLVQLLDTLEVIRGEDGLNQELEIEGVVACRVDYRNKHCAQVLDQLRERFGQELFTTVVRENVRLAEAPSFCQPITTYDPKSIGAQDYTALAKELLKRSAKSKRAGNN